MHALIGACVIVAALALVAAGTGFGAASGTSSSVIVTGTLEDTMQITDPTGLESGSSTGTSFASGATSIVDLGRLNTAPQLQLAAATWEFSTTASAGYTAWLEASSSPALQNSGTGTDFPDMCTVGGGGCPATCVAATCSSTDAGVARGFGVAIGNASSHNQGAVTSTWGTQGGSGTQGTLFGGVPDAGGVVIAQRTSSQTNDPVTISFAARQGLESNGIQEAGSYSGTFQVRASSL